MFNFDNSYFTLPSVLYTEAQATPVRNPKLILFNYSLAKSLDIKIENIPNDELALYFSGNKEIKGSKSLAQAYAGHQFGHFTQLGDGRAILLGEHISNHNKRYDIQLKGSGQTAYSRRGDGRAAIGPMLREYLISEAMYALKIPTTRSLAVVSSGEEIYRSKVEKGAILTRVAKSHIRVGTFEYVSAINDDKTLKELTDYTIKRHFTDLSNETNKYQKFLEAVIDRQVHLIAKWLSVGFIHGVMNTDNMAISGETIDYGPCAFMDVYNPNTTFSSIDKDGRYSYLNQGIIAQWNLARFAETLLPLLNQNLNKAASMAEEIILEFSSKLQKCWMNEFGLKLGLDNTTTKDIELLQEVFDLLEKHNTDFTQFFIDLTFEENIESYNAFGKWFQKLKERRNQLNISMEDSRELMRKANPIVIPRNHIVEEALLDAVENNNLSKCHLLFEAITSPFDLKYKGTYYSKAPNNINKDYRTFCGT